MTPETQGMINRLVTSETTNEQLAFSAGFERRIAINAGRKGDSVQQEQSTAIADACDAELKKRGAA